MDDLYSELDLTKETFTVEKAKRNYRKKAKKLHPDTAHGDAEQFGRVAFAWDVLSDFSKKKLYDETGRADGRAPQDSTEEEAMSILSSLIATFLQQSIEMPGMDMIKTMCATMQMEVRNIQTASASLVKRKERIKRLIKRLKYKGRKQDLIHMILDRFCSEADTGIEQNSRREKALLRAVELLRDYEMSPDMEEEGISKVLLKNQTMFYKTYGT